MNDHSQQQPAGKSLAIAAESLYVANLLILPFLAFLILVVLYAKHHSAAPPLAASHLQQTVRASLWIAVMFVTASCMVLLMKQAGIDDVTLWIFVVLAFTIIHASMVLLGVLGLARALAGKCWRYPLFGHALPNGCPQ